MALRAATKDRHKILDTTMPLANPDASWTDYLNHLEMLAAWLLPLETWLSAYKDGPQAAIPCIRYSDMIISDLQAAQVKSRALMEAANASWPKQSDSFYRWGISYVIEGSQLGGAFLYKRLAPRFPEYEMRYLNSQQAGRWPAFLNAMEKDLCTPQHISTACEGAMDAFDALLRQLSQRESL